MMKYGQVIKAWDIGVASMKRGEKCILTCKSEYAYGKSGSPPKIPPDSTLVFEVELFDWQGEDLSEKKDGGIIRRIQEKGKPGENPTDGSEVSIHLVGCYPESTVFDEREVTFTLGEGSEVNIPPGVETALEKFNKGETSKLYIKSKYAYSADGNSKFNIPPQADLQYTVTLKSFEKAKESWELDPPEKIEQTKMFKEKGTTYFKSGKYSLALKQYKKITSYLEHETTIEDEGLKKEREVLMLAGHLNLAACYLKLNSYSNARDECDKALEFDATNVKALFRRGQAYLGTHEPQMAKTDFRAALQLDPSNKAVTTQLNIAIKKIKEEKEKDKATYSNMFDKFAKADKERENALKQAHPDPMENPGEWGAKKSVETEEEAAEANLPNVEILNSGTAS